jgi:mycothiol synthase
LTAGVLVRPAGMSDVEAAHRVSEACAIALHGASETTVDHLRAAWDLGRAWVALDSDDEVIGYATLEDGYVEVWPHPDHRGGAVAGALLDAVTRHGGRLETIVPEAAQDLVALYALRGWRRTREVLRMQIDVSAGGPPPAWPEGIAVRTYTDADAGAVHQLLEEAFAGNAEEVLPFARWHPWMTNDPGFDPGVWFLAEAGAELAGACLCWKEGWVKDLAVRPSWRGRGLGEALLRAAFAELHHRGVETVGLKVDSDNPTGAVRLYERVGMARERTYVMLASE